MSGIEELLGHTFERQELLTRALTHSSFLHDSAASQHNEQMEFLGDAILGFVVSATLVKRFPDSSEGQLSKLKGHLVSASHLFAVATRIGLGQYLRFGKAEEKSGGRDKRAPVVDALEAVIAALYLDGGVDAASSFIVRHVLATLDADAEAGALPVWSYKNDLQELTRTLHLPEPEYRVVEEKGPAHGKLFLIEVCLDGKRIAIGESGSKKRAEQAAARAALDSLRQGLPH